MGNTTAKWGKPCHIYAVRCPHCGKPNDFREVDDALGDGGEYSDKKAKPIVECDHCHQKVEVVKVLRTVLIWTRKWGGQAPLQPKQTQVNIMACMLCNAEYYRDEETGVFTPPQTDGDGRPLCTCGGMVVERTVTREVGDKQQIFQAGQRIITCPGCKQQWYDSVPIDPKTNLPTCNCGQVLQV